MFVSHSDLILSLHVTRLSLITNKLNISIDSKLELKVFHSVLL